MSPDPDRAAATVWGYLPYTKHRPPSAIRPSPTSTSTSFRRRQRQMCIRDRDGVDWNADLVHGGLEQAVQRLKQEPGKGLFVGGVTLPLALADLGLIDEYEFLVQPVLAGHGPTLLAGLRERIQLELVDRHEFRSGAVALRYRPARVTA